MSRRPATARSRARVQQSDDALVSDRAHVDVDSLSPVAQDYLKTIWSTTEWGQDPITTKALAEKFGTSPASVTDTVKRLAGLGLVEYTPYKPVALTARGAAAAVQMVRRHRLIETFLVQQLSYGWDEVHDEAERLEHAVSDTFTNRIEALLDYPEHDPHGDPIPDATGHIHRVEHPVRLSDVLTGAEVVAEKATYEVVRVSDSDPHVLTAAEQLGIAPGAGIVVNEEGQASLPGSTAGDSARIPPLLAAEVWVQRLR